MFIEMEMDICLQKLELELSDLKPKYELLLAFEGYYYYEVYFATFNLNKV